MKRCFACFQTYENHFSVCPHCGCVENPYPVEPVHLVPGTVLAGRYLIGHAEGAGGFGIVYKAYDLKLETVVAVKEFFVSRMVTRAPGTKNLIISKKSQLEYQYRKERFLAEARNMAKFGAHRSIPNVFEFFEENNTAYIVMELLTGVPLNEYLSQHKGKVDVDFALLIANEVGVALKSLHEQNIIHRDVAPDNIYICSGKEIKIKLMDLGAAKLADSTDEVIDIILKPGYSPFEQYENSKNIGPWSDIYALGATLYVMLTGVKPDESTNRKIKDEVMAPHFINPMISDNLSNAIMKAMAVDKHMRFKTVSEFLEAINGERKVQTLATERKYRRLRRTLGVVAACAAVAVGLLVGLGTFNQKVQDQYLKPAEISVWFSVEEGSTEEAAMNAVKADFEEKFPDVTVLLKPIAAENYNDMLEKAAKSDKLPDLFESSGVSPDVLEKARDLNAVMKSDQFKDARFLNQYNDYYDDKKQMPLAIEVPTAYVITNGATHISYEDKYFKELSDFGESTKIAVDSSCEEMLKCDYSVDGLLGEETFLNNTKNESPVMLSSTMAMNKIRKTLTNYEKAYVYPNGDKITCRFIYEWSLGGGDKNQVAASDRLLSWMLGNVYQSTLMVSKCADGQIPVNPICFDSKIAAKNLAPLSEIYENFTFERQE